MNVAGALARCMNDGEPNFDSVARLLGEAVRTLPALATASGEPDEGDEILVDRATGGSTTVEGVVSLFEADPLFARMARPIALSQFISSEQAGLPQFSTGELDAFLKDVTDREPGYARSWLEFAPLEADNTSWVAYPQTSTPSLEFLLILPIRQGPGQARLLPLSMGLDVTGAITQAPRALQETGCDPRVIGEGLDIREGCVPRTCAHHCKPDWKTRRGVMYLTGCQCRD